jgi:endoribonuclease Dicer
MVERDNNAHRRILSQVTDLDRDMQRWTDTICRSQESSIPPPTLHESMDPYHSDSDEEQEDFIEDPITRRRLYVRDALVVIYRFAASLSVDLELASQPLFKLGEIRCSTQSRSSDEHCTIILPGFPIHGISGSHSFSKSLARRTACFNACRELHQKGFLDYRFFPIITTGENPESGGIGVTAEYSTEQSSLPLPAVNAENHTLGIRCYLRKTPDFWLCTKFAPIMSLYPTVISVNHSNSSSEPYASMLMLSRRPLPSLEPFKLFFFGIPAVINLTSCAELQLDEVKLVELYKYTMRICRSVANKAFDCPLNRMAYFFAPLSSAWTVSTNSRWELPSVLGHIPWHLVSLGAEAWAVELRSDDINSMSMDINDAVVQDRWAEFTKRYDVVKMRPDLNPLSKPMDSPVRCCQSASLFIDGVMCSGRRIMRTCLRTIKPDAKAS